MIADQSTKICVRRVLSRPVAMRSLWVAAVVGTVLNLINQGDALIGGQPVDWLKVTLTYCVPFLVASYGAFCAFRIQQ